MRTIIALRAFFKEGWIPPLTSGNGEIAEGEGVPRTRDAGLRGELLISIVDYVLAHGLSDLSLRPLAKAIDVSPRTMLYHFGSKEALVVAILDETSRRQLRLVEAWYERSAEHDARTLLLRAWQWLTAPRHDRLLRLLFESYGMALQDRRRHAAFLRTASTGWIAPFARTLERQGFSRERAGALATLIVAVVRGLLLDVLATGERTRVDRAFRSFIAAIELPAGPLPVITLKKPLEPARDREPMP